MGGENHLDEGGLKAGQTVAEDVRSAAEGSFQENSMAPIVVRAIAFGQESLILGAEKGNSTLHLPIACSDRPIPHAPHRLCFPGRVSLQGYSKEMTNVE